MGADDDHGTADRLSHGRDRCHEVPTTLASDAAEAERPASPRTCRLIENERLKLKANHLNGIATGIPVGAILAPVLTSVRYAGPLVEQILSGRTPTSGEATIVTGAVAAFAMAMHGLRFMRRFATRVLEALRDPDD